METISFQQAQDLYKQRSQLRSPHTLEAYLRAIALFVAFLDDKKGNHNLPFHQVNPIAVSETPISALSSADEPILQSFKAWLRSEGGKRPYSPATIELRLVAIIKWFQFIQLQGWFPSDFSATHAIALLKTEDSQISSLASNHSPSKAVTFEHDLSDFLAYYQFLTPTRSIQQNADGFRRWELSRLRNHAMIQLLAETGGQVSAILGLNVAAISQFSGAFRLQVGGKNDHAYDIHLSESLPSLGQYLSLRAVPTDQTNSTPLFVSHDRKHEGQRMSRIIAWRVIQRAAKAVQLPEISPHDLRHWRAKQLIATGHTPQEVQQQLGHRTVQTIYSYYGHWYPEAEGE